MRDGGGNPRYRCKAPLLVRVYVLGFQPGGSKEIFRSLAKLDLIMWCASPPLSASGGDEKGQLFTDDLVAGFVIQVE